MGHSTAVVRFLPLLAAWILVATPGTFANEAQSAAPDDWFARVSGEIRLAEYHFSWQDGRLQAPNRVHGLRTYVREHGFEAIPRVPGSDDFRLVLNLGGYGRPGAIAPVEPGLLAPEAGRTEILRNGIVEWLVNAESGLEHGFTLAAPPDGRAGTVALVLDLEGTLSAYPLGDRGVGLRNASGRTLLHYDKLAVFDALDRELPAWMEIGPGELRLLFDDWDAVYPVTVDPLLASPDWSPAGADTAKFGFSVKTAGDVNGDGFSDVIVGAPGFDGGLNDEGKVFVYHGSSSGVTFVRGDAAWSVESNQSNAGLGKAVSTAGDVDGDGFDDVIVAAPDYDNGQLQEGRVWIYYGSATGITSSGPWITESNQANAYYGTSVSFAGDVNNDGYHDVIIGAPYYDNTGNNNGRVFVYYGGANGPDLALDWAQSSAKVGVLFGWSVSGAGDVNGDGFGDLIVGAKNYDAPDPGEGRAFIYLGSATVPSYSSGPDGDQAGGEYGTSVSTAGDVNGDGYADVVIGAPLHDDGANADRGKLEILYGGPGGVTETGKTTIIGFETGARLGYSVATAGDVNGDGFADVIAGCPRCNNGQSDEGMAFVFRGSGSGIRSLDTVFGGFEYWIGEGNQSLANYGVSVATAGDVNGDGYSDVIVGADGWDEPLESLNGRAFVYHGGPDGLDANVGVTKSDGQTGSEYGKSVAHADVNGDGFSDVLVGDPLYDSGQIDEGAVFVYHGTRVGLAPTPAVLLEADVANASFGYSVAGTGDVNGDGFDDVLVGAPDMDDNFQDDGRAFFFFGSSAGLGAVGWANQTSPGATARLGHAVAGIGDVNGDGYNDIAIGAPGRDNGQTDEGTVWVFYGSASGLGFGAPDEVIELNGNFDQLGFSVAGAGDVNGDGYSDVIVGAPYAFGFQSQAGEAHLFLGSSAGLAITPVRTWRGDLQNEHYGWSVNTAGDVNGDGLADLIVGAPDWESPDLNHPNEGRFLVYAGDSEPGNGLGLLGSGEGNQSNARLGASVSTTGDVNNDGYADVTIASPGSPLSTVWYGSASGLPGNFSWGTGWAAEAVAAAGDVNGDGFHDLLIANATIGDAVLLYGGGIEGMDRIPRAQQPAGTSAPRIGLQGKSSGASSTRMRTRARTAAGRDRVQVEYEVKSVDVDFDGLGTSFSSQILSSAPGSDGSRVNYSSPISGLSGGPHYKWRLRHISPNPLFPRTPWFNHAGIAANQRALMTSCAVQTWFTDADSDGYGTPNGPTLDRCAQPPGFVADTSDCNDADASVNPGATEITCDGIDNDCFAGSVDAPNLDGDAADICDVTDPGDLDGLAADCDDSDPLISPAEMEQTCDGIDNNCSGMQDDAPDGDGDGYDVCEPEDPGDADGLPADCAPANPFLYTVPGEVGQLTMERIGVDTYIRWNVPGHLGGLPTVYDTVKSDVAGDFTSGVAVCVEDNGDNRESIDSESLSPGEIRYFLAIAVNPCGQGDAGTDSGGDPRDVQVCLP